MNGDLRCPKCSCPLDTVRLPEGVDIEACQNCFGAYYKPAELAVDVALADLRQSNLICPDCGAAMETGLYRHQLELDRCTACGGLWFDKGEIQKLRLISGRESVIQAPGQPPDTLMPHAALAAFAATMDEHAARAAGSPAEGGKTARDFSPPVSVPEGTSQSNADETRAPVVTFQKRDYKHFQTSWPVVTYVVGEFPWEVKVGEKATARDFISPPFLLSEEITGKDKVWSHGEYLEPGEVWSAFKLEGAPPTRVGVGAAQPNPYDELRAPMWGLFTALALGVIAAGVALGTMAQGTLVFDQGYAFVNTAAEKSFVTPEFQLEGHASNVEIHTTSSLDNQWAYLNMALINSDTESAIDFGRELSYYHGRDDEGSWSEGSGADVVYLPRVPPGRYYLRVEPETDTGNFTYEIRVRRDVFRPSFVVYAFVALLLPLVWVFWRCWAFEKSRWMDSDHPMVTASSDDDD